MEASSSEGFQSLHLGPWMTSWSTAHLLWVVAWSRNHLLSSNTIYRLKFYQNIVICQGFPTKYPSLDLISSISYYHISLLSTHNLSEKFFWPLLSSTSHFSAAAPDWLHWGSPCGQSNGPATLVCSHLLWPVSSPSPGDKTVLVNIFPSGDSERTTLSC